MSTPVNSKKGGKLGWVKVEEGYYQLGRGKQLGINNSLNESNHNVSGTQEGFQSSIQDNILFGEACLKQQNDIKLSHHSKETIIEVNAQTMEICEIKIGSPVVVVGDSSKQMAVRCWPSNTISLGKIGLTKSQLSMLNLEVNSLLSLLKPSSVNTAASVVLKPLSKHGDDNQFFNLKHFKNYISTVLDRTYVIAHQVVSILFFGKPFRFEVLSVISGNEDETEPNTKDRLDEEDQSDIHKSLSSLDISCQDDSLEFCSVTSTPRRNEKDRENMLLNDLGADLSHSEVFMLNEHTKYEIEIGILDSSVENVIEQEKAAVDFDLIGGLQQQIQTLKDFVILPMKEPAKYQKSGIKPVHGIILHGLPGTGKSLIAQAVASEAKSNLIMIRGSEIMSRFLGESEKQLQSLFSQARQKSPCVVVMDEIDTLCPRRETTKTDAERRIVASLINILDDLNGTSKGTQVVVIATTNRLESLDPALRRAGRFDREIEIPIPGVSDRVQILAKLLSKCSHQVTEREIEHLAELAHGYVGADLAAVCVEAGYEAIKRSTATASGDDDNVRISVKDVEKGLKLIPPSAMRELIVQVPTVRWSDIGGNAEVKKNLRQAVEWPLKKPESFARLGIDPPRGLLMYGPPGCSKTLTAKALATESGLNFISIKGSELLSKYVGDSERSVRRIFSKARSAAPAIIFFDELDALAIERGSGNVVADRVLAAMLTEMDGVEQRSDVIVVAATNRPDMIDKALLRPGRIDRILHVPLPDVSTRREIFLIRFRKMPIADDVNLDELVKRTEMYSGAEICSVCREAALAALDDDLDISQVSWRHFLKGLALVPPQTTRERVRMYEDYGKTLQTRIK